MGGLEEMEFDDDFFMFRAKVEMCPREDIHAYSTCPYLHPHELAQRRDPQVFKYDSIFCYDLHNTKVCRRGANCPYSHNLFEYFLHPSRYRTRMCEYGEDCNRELCFFAHNQQQLRARTSVKAHSGGRRSGKQHRAATAARAAAAFMGGDDTAYGPGIQFLQVPWLAPPVDDSPAQLEYACPHEALTLSGLTLQHDATSQHNSTASTAMPASVQQYSGLALQQLQPQSPPVVALQQGPSGAPPGILRTYSYDEAAAAPPGAFAVPSFSAASGSHTNGLPIMPVAYMEPSLQLAAAPVPPTHAAAQDRVAQPQGPANFMPASHQQAQGWAAMPPQQQQPLLLPPAHTLLPQQQRVGMPPQKVVLPQLQQQQQAQAHMYQTAQLAPAAADVCVLPSASYGCTSACSAGSVLTLGAGGAVSCSVAPAGAMHTSLPQLQQLLQPPPQQQVVPTGVVPFACLLERLSSH